MQKSSGIRLKHASNTVDSRGKNTVPDSMKSSSLLENLPLIVKITVIVLALGLGTVAVMLVASRGLGTMRYHVGNLYDFMLVPIKAISGADANLGDVQGASEQLKDPLIGAAQGQRLLERITAAEQSVSATIEKYNTEWVTTISPEFTTTLRDFGRLDLQEKEVAVLKSLNESHANAKTALERYLESVRAGDPDIPLLNTAIGFFSNTRAELQSLIVINDEFAQLSANDARAAYQQANLSGLLALGLSLLLGGLLTLLISRSIIGRLQELTRAAQELGQGRFDTQANVSGHDEIGLVGSTFNQAAQQLQMFSQQQEQERQRSLDLQSNVSAFLDTAMEIAQGDLTRRGTVTQDVLGNVVDSINLVVEEIGLLLKDVNHTALLVDQNANVMGQMSAHIAQSAEGQAKLAEQTRARAVEVTQSIRAMAQGAAQTTEVAQKTLLSAQQGQEAVQKTLSGMEGIRRETQSLAQGVRSLAERSLEVQGVVKTIANFASQTNLLALGAALEAAGAGEAGKRFATVADQVRRLADESTRATQQVAGLMKSFESDISALVERAEGSTREVEQGYAVASQAGGRLQEIAQLARQSAALVQGISKVTQQQVASVEQVSRAAQMIAQTAAQTGSESSKGRQAAAALQQRSVQLVSSLSRFQLPS